ncbi:MAG: hypothetical protein GQ559_07400 [Desulfobulbaceae bacterium]|nr:hypothetical protein [Desulfobulbaceae bacterium]
MTVLRVTVKLLLIFVLVYAGVALWYGRLEERLQGDVTLKQKVTEAKPVEKSTKTLQKEPDYQIIVQRNIFQAKLEVKEDLEKEEIKTEELEETSLRLALLGTVSGNEQDARAIIVDEKQKQQDIYQIGDAVQGAFIKEIERGKVVLEVGGKKEVLLIKDREGGKGPVSSSRRPDSFLQPKINKTRKTVRRPPIVKPHRRITMRPSRGNDPLEPDGPAEDIDLEDHAEPEEPILLEEEFTPGDETEEFPEPAEQEGDEPVE